MAEQSLAENAFAPLHKTQEIHGISRPSLSYWQDAWIRLKDNRRALFSLYLVIGLLLFTFLGPVFWQIDPAKQDVDQISQPPFSDRSVTLVAEYEPWYGDSDDDGEGLRFVEAPTTQYIRLVWDPLAQAIGGYRVYRNIFPVGPERAYGLPLIETELDERFFEDRLDLKPTTYYYTIVALDGNGYETDQVRTISGDVTRVITPSEARSRGLLDENEVAELGTEFTLATHPLGTDYLGRDMLARLMHGARVSLFIGFFAPLLYVLIGVIYGSIAGFVGGMTDQALMRFADFVVA